MALEITEIPTSALIVGTDARSHTIGWNLRRYNPNLQLFFASGNGGTEPLGQNVPIGPEDIDRIAAYAYDNHIGLTIVSPEVPLAMGIVDIFGTPIFGPDQAASRIEADKGWACDLMEEVGVPHPKSWSFTDPGEAMMQIERIGATNSVIKAAGLAAGKGVLLPIDETEAQQEIHAMMVEKKFKAAGDKVVIQQRISGPELSVVAFVDGENIAYLPPARDAKPAYDNDKGPNTGGMGAFAPVPGIGEAQMQTIDQTIFRPIVKGMADRGIPFKGNLYAGLMDTPEGLQVIEFNCRGGDPETEPQLMLLNENPLGLYIDVINGTLTSRKLRTRQGAAVSVVLASGGYPGTYEVNKIIDRVDIANTLPGVVVFHAGTKREDGHLKTTGGRVLVPSAYGHDIASARKLAYAAANIIDFDNKFMRSDIAATATS